MYGGKTYRDETVTRPLREEGNGDDNAHAAEVTGSGEELLPRRVGSGLLLKTDHLLDLVDLKLDEGVVVVATAVVLGNDVLGLLELALGDEPTGRLRNEEDEGELENRGKTLEDGGDAPRPSRGHAEGAAGG